MSCSDVLERLEELVDGLLPPEEADWRDAHVRSCPECAEHLAEASRFRALIAAEGSEALQDWHAHRLADRAAADAAPAAPAAQSAPAAVASGARRAGTTRRPAATAPVRALSPWRRAGVRYAAAAAVLAAGLFVGVGAIGTSGPEVLAAGKPLTLEPGVDALTGPGRAVRCERTLRIFVEPDTDGARVRVDGGAALFRIEEDRHCHVETPGGVAKADGSTFLLEVRQDESVAVSVLVGELRFTDRTDAALQVVAGERVEVDADRRAHLVSRARLAETELANEMTSFAASELRAELEQLRAENEALREMAGGAASAAADDAAATGTTPWDELGAALRSMLGRERFGFGGRGDEERDRSGQNATAVFYVHADAITELTGVRRPFDALTHPAFLAEVATGFMDALAPEAHAECRVAAADAMRTAAQRLQFVVDGDPSPTELLAARQRFARDALVAVRDNLGDEAAAEVAADLPRGWDPLRATPMDRAGAVAGVTAWWTRKLALDVSQASGLTPLVERYVAETLAVQQTLEDRLGAETAARILYPARRGGPWSRGRGGADAPGTPGAKPGEPATGPATGPGGDRRRERHRTTVEERLARLDAELAVARPRIEFERALVGLLREDQRERGLGLSFGLPTFRPETE